MLSVFGRKFHPKALLIFLNPRGFRKGSSQLRFEFRLEFRLGFGRDFGRKIASDCFASLGILGVIAWHVGWKIYSIITRNAGNHAKVFGSNFKIPCFAFERHV